MNDFSSCNKHDVSLIKLRAHSLLMTFYTAAFNRAQSLFSFQIMGIIAMEMPPIFLTSMSFLFCLQLLFIFNVAMPKTIAPSSSTKTAGKLFSSTYEKQMFLLLFSHHTKWLHRFSFRSEVVAKTFWYFFFSFIPKRNTSSRWTHNAEEIHRVFHVGKCLMNVYL